MRRIKSFGSILLFLLGAVAIQAQSNPAPSGSLVELTAKIPELVHSGKFDRGSFGDAVDGALRNAPSMAIAAAQICARNLDDADTQVHVESLAVLHAIAISPQGRSAVLPIAGKLAQLLPREDDWSQRIMFVIVGDLQPQASSMFIAPLEQVLQAPGVSDRNRVGAAAALAMAGATDIGAQSAIVNMIQDAGLSTDVRSQITRNAASPYVGTIISDNAVQLANTSTDKELRDAAISALSTMGPQAVSRVKDRLIAIQNDSAESLSSHRVVSAALKELQ